MTSRARSDDRGVESCAHSGQDRTNSPPSASSHPPGGGDVGKPEMLEEWRALGLDVDSSLETQP